MGNLFNLKYFLIILLVISVKIISAQKNGEVKASYTYCKHFNGTNIYLNVDALQELNRNQYISSLFTYENDYIRNDNKLDYFISYLVISKGLCYYEDEDKVKDITRKNETFPIYSLDTLDSAPGKMRYEKTVSCYYYYSKFVTPQSYEELKRNFEVCYSQCYEYLKRIRSYISDPVFCPFPDYDKMKNPAENLKITDRDQYIINLKEEFIMDLKAFCETLPQHNNVCFSNHNDDVALCGFVDEKEKNEYCSMYEDECCKLHYFKKKEDLKRKYELPPLESICIGSATAIVFLIIGSYFSYQSIKDIKLNESIEKSVYNQKQQYYEANKELLKNAYKNGLDPNDHVVINSSSRNLNMGTLRTKKPVESIISTSTMNSNSRESNSVSIPLSKYPPNTFTVIKDYTSTDNRDINLKAGMTVQLIQKCEGGWVLVKDFKSNKQGYAPEYCLGNIVM